MAQNAFFNALTHYRSCFPFLFSFGKRKTHLFMIQLKFCNISLLSRIGIVYYVPTRFIMLNSCASGVSVVNIDNGFGAGYLAGMMNHMGGKQ